MKDCLKLVIKFTKSQIKQNKKAVTFIFKKDKKKHKIKLVTINSRLDLKVITAKVIATIQLISHNIIDLYSSFKFNIIYKS